MARILYARWERLSPADREPLEPLASDVKQRALDVRGTVDDGQAERELERASDRFADALGEDEVAALRQELKDELDRAARRAA